MKYMQHKDRSIGYTYITKYICNNVFIGMYMTYRAVMCKYRFVCTYIYLSCKGRNMCAFIAFSKF